MYLFVDWAEPCVLSDPGSAASFASKSFKCCQESVLRFFSIHNIRRLFVWMFQYQDFLKFFAQTGLNPISQGLY